MPAELVLNYVWSMGSKFNATFDPSFLKSLYQQLLQLQVNRTLFNVLTGKRAYTNMLLASLSVTTDRHNENILNIRAVCREVLRATTQIVQLTSSAVQLLPQKTAPIINQGPVNLGPAPNFNATGVQ